MVDAAPAPRAKLTLVDEAFATVPAPADDPQSIKVRETEKRIVARYAGALTAASKRRWDADLTQRLGGYTLEQITARKLTQEAHDAEIDRITAERIQWVKEGKAHGRYQGISISAVILVPLAVFGMWGVMTLTRMDVIAAQRVQDQPAWTPPAQTEPQGFRP